MGVTNLLQLVDKALISTYVTQNDLPNKTAAVDISHWIYRACYSCPEALYTRDNMVKVYNAIVKYIDQYVSVLFKNNIKLVFVFDGMKLPAKRETHMERSQRKQEARQLVEKYLMRNNKSEARKHMLRCIEVRFDIIEKIIEYCITKKIDYIIAPYEADAQLAYLCNKDICQFVITEDTDLILYGCERIVYKLEPSGRCQLYQKSRLQKCFGSQGDNVDFEKFRRMCILSGCDYLKNIPGVGLQSAKKFFLLTRNDNIKQVLPKLAVYLNAPKLKGKVTDEYIRNFINAENTFRHHIVYDPTEKKLVPVEPYPEGYSSHDFPLSGKLFDRTLACDLVKGRINLDNFDSEKDLPTDDDEPIEDAKPSKRIKLA